MNPRTSSLAVALALIASCSHSAPPAIPPPQGAGGPAVTIGGKTILVDVWATERERRSTLYGLPRLEEGRGLLLAWPRERYVKVESEASAVSYDAAFLDRSGKIVDVQELKEGDPEGVMSHAEAAYALLVAKKSVELRTGSVATVPTVPARELPEMKIGGVTAHVELALTDLDRQHGLMFRPRMSADDGMLFAYAEEDGHSFWMKNTLIPLDIAFFAADGTLVNVNETPTAADPRAGPWPTAPSARPARYVLEMNLGWFKSKGLVGEDGKPRPGVKADIPAEAVKGRFD